MIQKVELQAIFKYSKEAREADKEKATLHNDLVKLLVRPCCHVASNHSIIIAALNNDRPKYVRMCSQESAKVSKKAVFDHLNTSGDGVIAFAEFNEALAKEAANRPANRCAAGASSRRGARLHVQRAPEPANIIWGNFGASTTTVVCRRGLTALVLLVLLGGCVAVFCAAATVRLGPPPACEIVVCGEPCAVGLDSTPCTAT
eukprot:SAG11_NODE_44_length_20765_cov_5.183635_4_plen_202_part_00